ncbi:MAG: hypothetical protein K0R34_2904 [Herbinix sp.]|jgi:hypothetical protein|nr:hypothetical protein [Herbinix sp.]
MKGFNLRIAEFKQNISALINESDLPIGVKQMVLFEAYNGVMAVNTNAIQSEALAYEEEAKKNAEEIHKD